MQDDLQGSDLTPNDDTRLDDCLRALRGESALGPQTEAYLFGQQLRERLQSEEYAMESTQHAADEALIARWRAQGLFRGRAGLGATAKPSIVVALTSWQRSWKWLLPTVFATVSTLLLVPWGQESALPPEAMDDEAIRMRGVDEVQRLSVAAPMQTAAQLEQVFLRHSLRANRRNLSDGTVQIQALVPKSDVVAWQELQTFGVQVPEHGRLDVLLVLKP